MEEERLEELQHEHDQLIGKVDSLQKTAGSQKDIWDILAATTPLVTGLLISSIGMYFAYTNNQAQLKLQETQTIEKFIPHLIGSEAEKKAAIIALSSITNTETAAKYAELFPSEGTASALKSLATSSSAKDSDRKLANKALVKTFNKLADDYQATQNTSKAQETYQKALAVQEKLVGKDSPELIDELEKIAEAYKSEKKYTLAASTLRRVLKIQRTSGKGRTSEAVETLNKMAEALRLDGKNYAADNLTDYADLLSRQIGPTTQTSQAPTEPLSPSQPAQASAPPTPTANNAAPVEAPAKVDITESPNKPTASEIKESAAINQKTDNSQKTATSPANTANM